MMKKYNKFIIIYIINLYNNNIYNIINHFVLIINCILY